MPRVIARRDNLNEMNGRFEQRPLDRPVFLNSVPKSGTHLMRNIVRMFVPVDASGTIVLGKLLDRWPVERVNERAA